MPQDKLIKTPETDPDHEVVGFMFRFYPSVYYCDSYDPRMGFWMTNVLNPVDRRNVSERAIHRTFHRFLFNQVKFGDSVLTDGSCWGVDTRNFLYDFAPTPLTLEQARTAGPEVALFFQERYATLFSAALRRADESGREGLSS